MTPREEIKLKNMLNGSDGYYGTHNQFIILIEKRLYDKATKIMNSLNTGFLFSNERYVHNIIYNFLLDGNSAKDIKNKMLIK